MRELRLFKVLESVLKAGTLERGNRRSSGGPELSKCKSHFWIILGIFHLLPPSSPSRSATLAPKTLISSTLINNPPWFLHQGWRTRKD